MLSANSQSLSPSPLIWGEPENLAAFPDRGRDDTPRLLYIATSKNDGGIERHSVRMAAELHRRGYGISFACRPDEIVDRRCRAAGVPVYSFRVRNSADIGAARRLADLIAQERIDLVHVHSRRDFVPAVMGVALARWQRGTRSPRLILHAHMLRALGDPPRLSGPLFAATADAVIAVSDAVRQRLLSDHNLPASFVHTVHNGVDLQTDATVTARETARRACGLPLGVPVIGMVGRLDAKGQASLLHIAPALIARFPALHFVFVGAEGESGERERLQAIAEAGRFADRVTLTGPRDDVPTLLPGFDLLAHLPTDEAFGLALAEAMAAGLPTVATDIGGCREVVRDGETGVLVPTDDLPALTCALSRLLSDAKLRHHWGDRGRQIAAADFAFSGQIDQLLSLYGELCPRPVLQLQ